MTHQQSDSVYCLGVPLRARDDKPGVSRLGLLAIVFTVLPSTILAAPAIEVLWDADSSTYDVRAEAMMLAQDQAPNSQVCWKYSELPGNPTAVEWQLFDAAGDRVYRHGYSKAETGDMMVSCSPSGIDVDKAEFGQWQYRLLFNGQEVARHAIEVRATVEDWSHYDTGYFPYVRGRTNYRAERAEDYTGRFVIGMRVATDGSVIDVELLEAEQATEFSARVVAASGWVYRFPPDTERPEQGMLIRQPFELKSD